MRFKYLSKFFETKPAGISFSLRIVKTGFPFVKKIFVPAEAEEICSVPLKREFALR